jgi:hypothetical protein
MQSIFIQRLGQAVSMPYDGRNGTDQIVGTDDIEMTRPVSKLKKHLYMH